MTTTRAGQQRKYQLHLPGVRRRLTPELSTRPRPQPDRVRRRDRFDGTPPLQFA